jgi:hypothetical protein
MAVEKLSIAGCDRISGASIKAICKHALEMKSMSIHGAKGLSDKVENHHIHMSIWSD